MASNIISNDIKFPDPPREVYYIWLVHMLQPLAYKLDCLEHFSRCIPHLNHIPNWSYTTIDKDSPLLSSLEIQVLEVLDSDDIDELEGLPPLFTHVIWEKGLDGVRAIHDDMEDYSPAISIRDDKFIDKVMI